MVREMLPHEKGFFSSVLFIKKETVDACGMVRKVIDFRLLNAYSKTLRSDFPGTMTTLRSIQPRWNVFTTIDLKLGYHHISVDRKLQFLFRF